MQQQQMAMAEQQIIARFKQMKQEQQSIVTKIGELEIEVNDHKYHIKIVTNF